MGGAVVVRPAGGGAGWLGAAPGSALSCAAEAVEAVTWGVGLCLTTSFVGIAVGASGSPETPRLISTSAVPATTPSRMDIPTVVDSREGRDGREDRGLCVSVVVDAASGLSSEVLTGVLTECREKRSSPRVMTVFACRSGAEIAGMTTVGPLADGGSACASRVRRNAAN